MRLTHPMKLTDLHEADGSCGRRGRACPDKSSSEGPLSFRRKHSCWKHPYHCKNGVLWNLAKYDVISLYSSLISKWLYRNYYFIPASFVPYNTYSYYTIIISIVYHMWPKKLFLVVLCCVSRLSWIKAVKTNGNERGKIIKQKEWQEKRWRREFIEKVYTCCNFFIFYFITTRVATCKYVLS